MAQKTCDKWRGGEHDDEVECVTVAARLARQGAGDVLLGSAKTQSEGDGS